MASEEDYLPECCGSGCTNCVLDRKVKFRKHPSTSNRPSLLDSSYKPFQCVAITQRTPNTFHFRFRYHPRTEDNDCAGYELQIPPGSHLMLRAPRGWRQTERGLNAMFSTWRNETASAEARVAHGGDRKSVEKYDRSERDLYFSRPYTPIQVDRDANEFEVLIRMETAGEMSEYLQTLNVGDVTEWKGVYTGFVWERNARKNLICLAQGVGLAPIYSIVAAILEDEADETRLKLVYCCKDVEGILMRDELLKLGAFWNFEATIYLSRESCFCGAKSSRSCACLSSKKKYNERVLNHRLEKIDIETLLLRYAQDSLQVLICGTESFATLVESCLVDLNIRDYYKF
ncbi:NADH-cytochrome b5 reductase-like [Ochlerotatus camptorhynchus]|uniref:NADH-cytochrome b5 reductase-like n=1 Tax=Ochlerotatus camptorhynchus TaxID=644619 RepID=UPI0031DB2FA6